MHLELRQLIRTLGKCDVLKKVVCRLINGKNKSYLSLIKNLLQFITAMHAIKNKQKPNYLLALVIEPPRPRPNLGNITSLLYVVFLY